jgi:hypothetical protein
VCVCVYSVFVLPCVKVAALQFADHSSKEHYRLCKKDYGTEEEARAQQRAVEPLMNELSCELLLEIFLVYPERPSMEVKMSVHETNQLSPCCAQAKNSWNYISLPQTS